MNVSAVTTTRFLLPQLSAAGKKDVEARLLAAMEKLPAKALELPEYETPPNTPAASQPGRSWAQRPARNQGAAAAVERWSGRPASLRDERRMDRVHGGSSRERSFGARIAPCLPSPDALIGVSHPTLRRLHDPTDALWAIASALVSVPRTRKTHPFADPERSIHAGTRSWARPFTEPGAVIENATVVIRDGLIVSVEPGGIAPDGAEVWDYTGLHARRLPGVLRSSGCPESGGVRRALADEDDPAPSGASSMGTGWATGSVRSSGRWASRLP